MTETVLVAGTASHVGKSTVATGLCRLLADRGYAVAPFKAQNMSTNARVVLSGSAVGDDAGIDRVDHHSEGTDESSVTAAPSSAQWGEIGVSQLVQSRAARTTPTTDSNPVLLKPRGDGESQLVIDGRAVGHFEAGTYYERHWETARDAAIAAHRRLSRAADVIVAEGAGSIAEINLHDRDLANIETARFADAKIVICADIERGGAFASIYGTLELLPEDVRDRVVGVVITKFRGDQSLLEPGIRTIEARCDVPVLGVIPYEEFDLPEEDSLGLPDETTVAVRGADDNVSADHSVTVAVPRLPRLSNAADVDALAAVPGVRCVFVPLTDAGCDRLAGTDAVVIPGTKNTVDDTEALVSCGMGDAIRAFDGPIVGICGGYQLLGRRLVDAQHEGTGSDRLVEGLDVLPVETRFGPDKQVRRRRVSVDGAGPIAAATGTATGYEIHAGETSHLQSMDEPLEPGSAVRGSVLGTYLHGLFDTDQVRSAFVEAVYRASDTPRPSGSTDRASPSDPYDRVATVLAESISLSPIVEELSPIR
ncbi:cobyric acid synthase CobQ [Halovivax ruber XH-70]|uniref:Probable cobyric acid synthase n=1 Tax=Halovivax ruber (strain DSM 18193 / JCM 13892 / XH-70) TaxID=797302 RepID=L0I943_HALRX|nr:cobyric acid synthase [Halovivax ruber]AGB16130.1 cobyric acid synthase CobQ [Halovivax ruber XH-70]